MRIGREADSEAETRVTQEIEIGAPPEEVWEALATEQGRERWLGDEGRDVDVEHDTFEPHHRLTWWWQPDRGERSRVEFRIVAVPDGSRVIVTETLPRLPLATLAASFELVAA